MRVNLFLGFMPHCLLCFSVSQTMCQVFFQKRHRSPVALRRGISDLRAVIEKLRRIQQEFEQGTVKPSVLNPRHQFDSITDPCLSRGIPTVLEMSYTLVEGIHPFARSTARLHSARRGSAVLRSSFGVKVRSSCQSD